MLKTKVTNKHIVGWVCL